MFCLRNTLSYMHKLYNIAVHWIFVHIPLHDSKHLLILPALEAVEEDMKDDACWSDVLTQLLIFLIKG